MKKVILAAALIGLAGCSANPFKSDTTEIKASKGSDSVPTWYLETPEDSKTEIFAVASGLSDDMQFSLDKALHEAKITLGDKLGSTVTSQTKKFIRDNAAGGLGNTVQETEKVSRSGYQDVDVSSYVVVNKKIFMEGSRFRTYVLLKLDVDESAPVVEQKSQYTEEDAARADKAFDTL